MEITGNTKTSNSIIFSILSTILLFGAFILAYLHWPPENNWKWICGSIFSIVVLYGCFGFWMWVLFPSKLVLKFTETELLIPDRAIFSSYSNTVTVSDIAQFIFGDEGKVTIKLKKGKSVPINEVIYDSEVVKKELKRLYPSIPVSDWN